MDGRVTAWSSSIETGIQEIDAQHRELFLLAASFRDHGDEIRIMKSLAILCDYAKDHLNDEEAMLVKIGYPEIEEHRRAHAEFRRLLRELLAEARGLTLDQIASRVEVLINDWFLNHIMHVDMLYIPMVLAYRERMEKVRASCRSSVNGPAMPEDDIC